MTRNLLRAGALSCGLLTSTAFCTQPAIAQSAPAPRFQEVDGNGVDLISGRFVFGMTEGSIGSGPGAVSLQRSQRDDYGRTDQWSGIAFERTAGGTTEIVVQFGGRSDIFTVSGGGYVSKNGDGATLTGSGGYYTYRAADGTEVQYVGSSPESGYPIAGGGCSLGTAGTCGIPTQVTRPDGIVYTLSWTFEERCYQYDEQFQCLTPAGHARFAGVQSSTGYGFTFTYATDYAGPPSQGGPRAEWFKRTGATFTNSVNPTAGTRTISYATPSTGVEEVTDMAGRVWRITSNSSGQITGLRRPGSSSDNVTVVYGSGGVVTSVTKDGVTTTYSRSVSGTSATTTITNALNQQTSVVADLAKGRIASVTDALNRTTSFQYDASSRLTRTTAPEGNYTQVTYDGRGNVVETRNVGKPGSSVAEIVTTASYDASCTNPVTCNSPNSVTDARGKVTEFTYDATHGGVLTATAPAPTSGATRPQTRYAYTLLDGEYRLTSVSACASGTAPGCVGTANETRTVIGYDARGNVVSVEQRDGTGALSAVQTATYNAMGDVETMDGPLAGTGDTSRIRYNGAREVIGTIGPDPDGAGPLKHRATRNIISGTTGLVTRADVGTVNSQSDSDWLNMAVHQSVEADYDAHARPTVQRLVSGSTTYALSQTSYDALGRQECSAQRMNPAAFGSLPASACSLGAEGTFGPDRIAKTSYDAAGQVTQMLSAVGTPEQAVEAAMTYLGNGQVETLTDGEGNRTTYVYDGHDRLKQSRYPSPTTDGVSSTTDYEELGYDAAGNVVSRRLRDGNVLGFGYDALNRLTLVDNPQSGSTANDVDASFTYDLLGRMTRAQDQNGHFAEMTFDALGRQTGEASLNGGAKTMQYDAAGRRTRLTWPDGFFVTYDYNNAGDMTHIRENGAASGAGVLATFSHDDLGRRTFLARGNGAGTSYGYDAAGRLSHIGHHIPAPGGLFEPFTYYSYNPAGQIASVSRPDTLAYSALANQNVTDSHNGLNQVTQSGAAAVTHDARGNVTADAAGVTFGYNLVSQLVSKNGATQLYYDPAGRLTQQWNGGGTLDWVGSELVADYSGGFGNRRHVHGPGVDEPLVTYENGQRKHLHADERGSVVILTDDASNIAAINRYDEYGQPQGGTVAGRFGFTGQAWLPEMGVHYYKARTYHQGLGRFMQPDPIGYGDGMNLYGYVGGDPVNLRDPAGLQGAPTPPEEEPPIVVCGGTRDRSGRCVRYQSEFDRTFLFGLLGLPGKLIGELTDSIIDSLFGPGPHDYTEEVPTECSAATAFEHFRQPNHSAPLAPYAEGGRDPRTVYLFGGNPISQSVDVANMTIVNSTLVGHTFHPGSVSIAVASRAGGYGTIRLRGSGTGPAPFINRFVFYKFFVGTARHIAESCVGGQPVSP